MISWRRVAVYLCMCWCKQWTMTGAKVVQLRLTACWQITRAYQLISVQLQCCRRLHLRSCLWSLTAAAPSPVLVRSSAFNNNNNNIGILPSNLRSTTHECVHLVTHGHTIQSVIAEYTMLHANLMALSFIETDIWSVEVLHCGNRDFRHFLLLWPDLDPMTFICELDPYSLETDTTKVIYHATSQVVSNNNNKNDKF